MKKSTLASVVLCCLVAMFQLACGRHSGPPSHLSKRVFAATYEPSTPGASILIVDAAQDQLTASSIALPIGNPTITQLGPNNTTVVLTSGVGISVIDNTKEKVAAGISLVSPTTGAGLGDSSSMVEASDGNTLYTAHRSLGMVAVVDVTGKTVNTTIAVPSVRRLALSPDNLKLLAFSDDVDSFSLIDTSAKTATILCGATAPCAGLSRPTYAAFSSDSKTAYVIGCGAECGGTTASLAVFDMTQTPPVQGKTISLGNAADMVLSYSGKLYITGSDPNQGGQLKTVDPAAMAITSSQPVSIGNGFHTMMTVASNNKLFIGAQTCSTGCLSMVDLSANTSVAGASRQAVTGIAPIPGRSVVYVSEDGALHIYDTTTSQQTAKSAQVAITGIVNGVVAP